MIGFKIEAVKKTFFDPRKILAAAEKARYRALSKQGAFVRRRFKGLIRNKKKSSAPGQPPSGHPAKGQSEGMLEKFCFFGYDQNKKSMFVGPAILNGIGFDKDGRPTRGTVPQVLNEGGEISILEVFRNGVWVRAKRKRRQDEGLKQRFRRVRIEARPAIGPALEAEKAKFPELFRNAIK